MVDDPPPVNAHVVPEHETPAPLNVNAPVLPLILVTPPPPPPPDPQEDPVDDTRPAVTVRHPFDKVPNVKGPLMLSPGIVELPERK